MDLCMPTLELFSRDSNIGKRGHVSLGPFQEKPENHLHVLKSIWEAIAPLLLFAVCVCVCMCVPEYAGVHVNS